jgi:hypothetical protein
VESCAALSAELDSSAGIGGGAAAGVLGGVVADGAVALLVRPAGKIAAARISGRLGCFISELLARVIPCGEHHTAPVRDQ